MGVRLVEEKGIIDIENVFTRFYKSDFARTGHLTGLGLTIIKEFVESMDGTIQASMNENIFRIQVFLTKKKIM